MPSVTGTNGVELQKSKAGKTYYGGTKCLEAIEEALGPEQYKGFLRGNVMKYVWRYAEKNGVDDLIKALDYMTFLIEKESK